MLDINDFAKKQIVVYAPVWGDKMSFRNDNIIITTKYGEVKFQQTCHTLFMIIVVGDTTITTGLIRRARKFGFSICFFTLGLKLYTIIDSKMEGNTLLHMMQYKYNENLLANKIVFNKVLCERKALNKIRNKTQDVTEGICILDEYLDKLNERELDVNTLLAIEGNAAKVYFSRIFNRINWKGRKPRIKYDYINSLLDIGYTVLFNFIDAILQVYGFDTYKGVLHKNFYMRKSLVCDIMEPFRVIVDWKVRTGIQLEQFKKTDFIKIGEQWHIEYKKSSLYTGIILEEILKYKKEIFLYIRSYYRCFIKDKDIKEYPVFEYS